MNRQWLLFPTILIAGVLLGYFAYPNSSYSLKAHDHSKCAREHTLLNPELDCINSDEKFTLISEAETDATEYIANELRNGNISRASVFYRDLNTGRWFGVNELESFSPASLLKLPLAVAYYKLAEIDPTILSQSVSITEQQSYREMQTIKPNSGLRAQESKSVAELLELMLVNSDNEIFATLASGINSDFYNKVNLDLGVHFPTSGGIEQNFVSTKVYGAMLRSLYNSTYLSPDNSQQILNMLTKTKFDEGISSGVPRIVTIANKFGEREVQSADGTNANIYQLHDCGVVYAKNAPYIICIMTEGKNQKKLLEIIGELSDIVYRKSSMSQ